MACRGLSEDEPTAANHESFLRARRWMDEHGFAGEIEVKEAALFDVPFGELDAQSANNATWCGLEGCAVLAWSLGAIEMPAHESPAEVTDLPRSLGFMSEPIEPRLRPVDELAAMHNRLINIDWRLQIFWSHPDAVIDFRALAEANWFGPFDLSESALAADDLAIAGKPLAGVDRAAAHVARSIAIERLRAIMWLAGAERRYCDVRPWG